MKPKTIFRQENNLAYQLRRSQLVIMVLSVVLALVLLNDAYGSVNLSARNVRPLVTIAAALVLVEAIFSMLTFVISYHKKQK